MRTLVIIISMFFHTGCISSGPVHNPGFSHKLTLDSLTGKYKNLGERGDKQQAKYLSKILWPNDKNMVHMDIDVVEVNKINKKALKISAMADNTVVKVQSFVLGEDFEIIGHRVKLDFIAGVFLLVSNELILGPYYSNTEFGIDREGHGKFRQKFATFGLFDLVLPIAFAGTDDVRFVKLGIKR